MRRGRSRTARRRVAPRLELRVSLHCRLQGAGERVQAEGTLEPRRDLALAVDREQPGLGLEVKRLELRAQPTLRLVVHVDLLVDERDLLAEALLQLHRDI